MHTYSYPHRFHLESGDFIDGLTIAYHTFGSLSPARDNVLWVCHGLTANSDLTDWWPGAVGPDGFIDTSRHFVVCANLLGSHYGTTGPLSVNPDTGGTILRQFPENNHPRHGEGQFHTRRSSRHKENRHSDRGIGRRISGSGVGGKRTGAFRQTCSRGDRSRSLPLVDSSRRGTAHGNPGRRHILRTQTRCRPRRNGGGTGNRTAVVPWAVRL